MSDSFQQFVWFQGVVEGRDDPLQMGRVRVRCVGWHTEYKCSNENAGAKGSGLRYCIDTEDLPWATVACPTMSGGGMTGLGASVPFIQEGTWVVGFFRDGDSAQFPIVTHVIPGVPECPTNTDSLNSPDHQPTFACDNVTPPNVGFVDDANRNLVNFPRMPKSVDLKSGSEGIGTFVGYAGQSHFPSQKKSCDPSLAKGEGDVSANISEHPKAESFPLHHAQDYAYLKGSLVGQPDTNRLARGLKNADDYESPERPPVGSVPKYDPKTPTTPELLEHHKDSHIDWKLSNIDIGVPMADIPLNLFENSLPQAQEFYVGPSKTTYFPAVDGLDSAGGVWSEPKTPFAPVFPFNHVFLSESGHLSEIDDTPGRERLHRMHRSGTFEEIYPNGTRVTKVVGEEYTIIMENNLIHIEANQSTTVDKACKIYVNADNQEGNNFDIHVGKGGNLNIYAESCVNIFSEESISLSSKKTLRMKAKNLIMDIEDTATKIVGELDVTVKGDYDRWVGGDSTKNVEGNQREEVTGNNIIEVEGNSFNRSAGSNTIVGAPIFENPTAIPKVADHQIPDNPVSIPKNSDEDGACNSCA